MAFPSCWKRCRCDLRLSFLPVAFMTPAFAPLHCLSLYESLYLALSGTYAGGKDQPFGSPTQGAAHPPDGAVHGVLLPAVLDALRRHSADGHLRHVRAGHTYGQRGAFHPGQVQHCREPSHLHLFKQPGKSRLGNERMAGAVVVVVGGQDQGFEVSTTDLFESKRRFLSKWKVKRK